MRNVCSDIQCPYNDARNGCRLYGNAMACHVAWQSPGVPYLGMAPHNSEYWLYASDDYDQCSAKARNDEYLSQPREARRLAIHQRRGIS